jgi:hypothetical protein
MALQTDLSTQRRHRIKVWWGNEWVSATFLCYDYEWLPLKYTKCRRDHKVSLLSLLDTYLPSPSFQYVKRCVRGLVVFDEDREEAVSNLCKIRCKFGK